MAARYTDEGRVSDGTTTCTAGTRADRHASPRATPAPDARARFIRRSVPRALACRPLTTLLLPPTPVAQEFALALSLGFGHATLSLPNQDAALLRLEPELTRLSGVGSGLYIVLDSDARSDPRWQSLASGSIQRFEHRSQALRQTALKFPEEVQSMVHTVWIGPVRSPAGENRAP